jgi:CBS domain containing-hemolysin-like protein
MYVEVLILVALVLANGLFAGAEIAVLTAPKTLIEQRRDRSGKAVLLLRAKPERFLATVQIGITMISAAAAAFGGATIARDLSAYSGEKSGRTRGHRAPRDLRTDECAHLVGVA